MKKIFILFEVLRDIVIDAYSWLKFKFLMKRIRKSGPIKVKLDSQIDDGISGIFFDVYTFDEYTKFRQTKKNLKEFIQNNPREKTLDGKFVTPDMIAEMTEKGFVGRSFRLRRGRVTVGPNQKLMNCIR